MSIEKIGIDTLLIDRRVQREFNQPWANKIARELDLNQIGIITVSRRSNTNIVILDGQHRVKALRIAGHVDYKADCRVLEGLTLEQEARTFRLLNNTKKPNLIDHFLVRVVEGDETATDINKILSKFGWQPSRSKVDGSFSAISTIEAIYRESRDAAWTTIQTVTDAWGNSLAAVNGQIISGIGAVYQRYGDEIVASRMVSRLASITPSDLLIRSRALAAARGRRVGSAVSELVVAEYNKQRGPKIVDWNLPRTAASRKATTENIRALTKVANETAAPVAMPLTDVAELFKAIPDVMEDVVWR